jgi:hypothetical protein
MKTVLLLLVLAAAAYGVYRLIWHAASQSNPKYGAEIDKLRDPSRSAEDAAKFRADFTRKCESDVLAQNSAADVASLCGCMRRSIAAVPDPQVLRWVDYQDLEKVKADPDFRGLQETIRRECH